ncbi:hypothetical protein OROGR_031846 [Orobanche gracilis]
MEFCPTCANMLLYELPQMEKNARFYCRTCPYICRIDTKVKIKRHLRLVRKPIDPIFSQDDQRNLNKTKAGCRAQNVVMGKLLSPKCRRGQQTNQ